MRLRFLAAAFAVLSLCLVARADTITDHISFTATNGDSGSFTLTFDPTMNYTNSTAGLVVNSVSIVFPAPVASGFTYDVSTGHLTIGGLVNGVESVFAFTNDYDLLIVGMNTASPRFLSFNYTSPTTYITAVRPGSVTFTQDNVAVTPEPSSFMLLGTGLLGLAGVVKRRFA